MILAAFILDAIMGDPHWMPHPVRFFGFLISRGEAVLRRVRPRRERLAGAFLTAFVTLTAFAVPFLFLFFLFRFNFRAGFILSVFMAYQTLAARCLRDEAMKVYRAAFSGDLEEARFAVSMIVGRDTDRLLMEGVTKAAVETVAENLSDGVIAPLFYLGLGFVLGGPPLAVGLAFFYKASNTLDSMIGYKNELYLDFGRCAAKLDDALNFIPARLSGLLIILAAAITGLDAKGAAHVYRRDRKAHASPNAGHPEAACAGALGLALAGGAYYGGVFEEKPVIGDGRRNAEPEDIRKACKLMYVSALLFLVFDAAAEITAFLAGSVPGI
jgi:adenosylcobinamide-phosphate synthase